jgi:hypothetical protein
MPQVKDFRDLGAKKETILHVDDWLDTPSKPSDTKEAYAKFFLEYKRRPAWQIMAFEPWMKQFKLFCLYEGTRYRVTGASRMGDVWLTLNFFQEHGYELRVNVAKCSNWDDKP